MIVLMRHGQDDPDWLGGWSDAGLTEEGRRQAEEAAEKLRRDFPGIRRIYASDLPRAWETAEIAAREFGLPVVPVPGFRETNNGRLAGMQKAEAREKYPGIFFAALDFDEPYPGGESPRAFRDRIEAAWAEFRRDTEELRGDTLLVTHAGVINVILCHESGIPFTNREMTWPTPHAGIVAVESTGSTALTS